MSKKNDADSIVKQMTDKCTAVISDYKGEYKKIIWPSREELIKQTVSVIVVCVLIGLIIAGFDWGFGLSQSLFSKLVS